MGQKGSFILGQVYNKQMTLTHPVAVSTSTNNQSTGFYNSWDIPVGTFGWITGGQGPIVGAVERIDFANDTATPVYRSTLPNFTNFNASVANSAYAWASGGGGSSQTTVFRIDFVNDTNVASTRGPMAISRARHGANSDGNFGWFSGGQDSFPTRLSSIERIDFANDLATGVVKVNLPAAQDSYGTTSNASYGWLAGGGTNVSSQSTVLRLDFKNDGAALLARGSLTSARYGMASTGNLSYGYVAAGVNSTGPILTSILERIDYSTDSATALTRGNVFISTYRRSFSATGNANYGWFIAGVTGPANLSTVDRVDYANDTATAAIRGPLSSPRFNTSSVSNYNIQQPTYNPPNGDTQVGGFGWIAGGVANGFNTSGTARIDFTNDTLITQTRGPLTAFRGTRSFGSSNATYGWFSGGSYAGTAYSSTDRVTFANDLAAASAKGNLSVARSFGTSVSNTNYAWQVSGEAAGVSFSYIDRSDYSNDLALAVTRTVLPATLSRLSGASNANYGWTAGGLNLAASVVSSIYRVDFNNDSIAATTRGSLPATIHSGAGTSNRIYGWFAGGGTTSPASGGISNVYRVDFSNDTATSASSRGPLTGIKYSIAGTGNANYGWFSGGSYGGAVDRSTIDRIDYSNDSVTAAARTTHTAGIRWHAGISNYVQIPLAGNKLFGGPPSQGYWVYSAGGGSIPTLTSIERLSIANDTVAGVIRGSLNLAVSKAISLSGLVAGYTIGGNKLLTPGGTTNIQRMMFSNDTVASTTRNYLSAAIYSQPRGVGNTTHGWVYNEGVASGNIWKIDFSSDNGQVIRLTGNTDGRANSDSTSGPDYGWFIGGANPVQPESRVDRLEFNNDLSLPITRGPLSIGIANQSAIGNRSFGYSAAGNNPAGGTTAVDRIDYSNDSVTALTRGPLASGAYHNRNSGGNAFYGYLPGTGPSIQATQRIDYSNDTATSLARGPSAAGRYNGKSFADYVPALRASDNIVLYNKGTAIVSTGAGTYGWNAGGSLGATPYSRVDRIDFSTDSVTQTIRGNLNLEVSGFASVGNANYGWFAGGSPGNRSTVERIDYTNDSVLPLLRTPLLYARSNAQGIGNSSYGWITGGQTSTRMERLDFSNDISNTTYRVNTLSLRYGMSMLSTSNFGWSANGFVSTYNSNIDRMVFANDTSAPITRSFNPVPSVYVAGASNAVYGWMIGGTNATPAFVSSVTRLDFSNDTVTPLVRGPLTLERTGTSASNNNFYAWVSGGQSPAPAYVTTTDRIDFSNDSATAISKGALTIGRSQLSSTSNYTK